MFNSFKIIGFFCVLLISFEVIGQSVDSTENSLPTIDSNAIKGFSDTTSFEDFPLQVDSSKLFDNKNPQEPDPSTTDSIKSVDSEINTDAESNEFDFEDSDEADFIHSEEPPLEEEIVFKPQLSVGIGMLTFYGDIGKNNEGYHPMVSRLATTLRLINPINDFLDVGFYVMFGEISANERSLSRNLNFKSNITTGGITFNYNFNQFLRKSRIVEPYIHIGFESIEFLSKTDLKDANGNTYHYWKDGSIKDMSESDPNAANASDIVRDYNYESDIREQDFDGFGKYAERTFGVPLEIGANLYTGERLKFRVGTAMHFTFSDLIDGVTDQSVGDRVGNSGNDKLLFTHIAISYDFNIKTKKAPKDPFDQDLEMYFLEDTIDSDGDLVVDHMDRCAKTPLGVSVDEYGCPLDDDVDGVSNTLDQELLSMVGAVVNDVGVTLTDDDYNRMYRIYTDTTGEFSDFDTLHSVWSSDPRSVKDIIDKDKITPADKQLFIVIGSDVEGVSANDLWKKLANKDFQVKESGDSVMYVLGGYDETELVEKIKELEEDSIDVQGVVEISENNEITNIDVEEVIENVEKQKEEELASETKQNQEQPITNTEELVNDPIVNTEELTNESKTNSNEEDEELIPVINVSDQEASFRVQIGAFSKKISKKVFKGLPDLVSVKGDDGLYRFFSGSYVDKDKAASHKVDLSTSGYNDAFIVAFKDGKRITLREAGFEVDSNYTENIQLSSTPSLNAIDSKLVKFRIQVGAYREKVPVDALDLFLDIGKVLPKRDISSGLTKYYVGEFKSYQEAIVLRDNLVDKGVVDCFIVGEFKNNIISSKEALNLLGN
jgi:hypothetical protein